MGKSLRLGRKKAPNGYYDPADGSIHIDLNAGQSGKGTMLFTVAHELAHFIKDWSSVKYMALADALVKQYQKRGVSVSELVDNQIEKAKLNGREMSRLEAFDEMVADSMESMLTDENAAAFLERLAQRDKGLKEKIVSWLKELAAKLKNALSAYKDVKPDSPEGKMVAQMEDFRKEIMGIYTSALVDAGENFRNSVKSDNTVRSGVKLSPRVGVAENGMSMYEGSFPKGTPKSAKSKVILDFIQNVWSKNPIPLTITEKDGSKRTILAQFDPTYDPEVKGDASKIAGGNRHGNAVEQRVTLDLGPDYHQILSESTYNYSKNETGKDSEAHKGVKTWHYFIDEIYFAEKGSKDFLPYIVSINIKEKETGNFVYSFSAERRESSTPGTLHAQVSSPVSGVTNAELSIDRVSQPVEEVKQIFSDRDPTAEATRAALEKENGRLREDVSRLRELLRLQGKVTGGTVMKPSSVEAAARWLNKYAGAKADVKELSRMLTEFYRFIATDKDYGWEDVHQRAMVIAEYLQDNVQIKPQMSDYARDVLRDIRGIKITLDDSQRAEAEYQYGCVDAIKS